MLNALTPKKVLVAPLDWGLGHATRCIPIINELLKQNCEVQIASSGRAFILLKEEFQGLKFHELVSYDAKYPVSIPFLIKMMIQVPKFLSVIRKEHWQLERIVDEEKIDLVISDNRYGCWSKKAKSIFLGHQLTIKAPLFSNRINSLNEKVIKRFAECWVPDEEGNESLAGELAINPKIKSKCIGLLSRMTWTQTSGQYDILAILSGPEPHRTFLEKIITSELKASKKKSLIVRGLPGKNEKEVSEHITIIDHLRSREMNKAILESDLIVSRSGYSTIMDLAMLGKKAIFIPTPGQPEQEYLSRELMKKGVVFSMPQDNFNLQHALAEEKKYSGFVRRAESDKLRNAIKKLLNEIN